MSTVHVTPTPGEVNPCSVTSNILSSLSGGLFVCTLYIIHMFIPSESSILMSVIGMIGLMSTFVVFYYAGYYIGETD